MPSCEMHPKFSHVHSCLTQSNHGSDLYSIKPRLELPKRNFRYGGVHIWSDLPEHIKKYPSLDILKKLLELFNMRQSRYAIHI